MALPAASAKGKALAAMLAFCACAGGGVWGQTLPPLEFGAPQLGSGRGPAPRSAILIIQSDRLFAESAFGRRITREIEAEGAVLTAENRRIEAELRAEELELTERRATMEPEAFRVLADAFDAKVQETRAKQDSKFRAISQMGEDARRAFFSASLPVLQKLMSDAGAGVILEKSSVLLSADAADITDLAIARIDAVLGEGGGPAQEVQE